MAGTTVWVFVMCVVLVTVKLDGDDNTLLERVALAVLKVVSKGFSKGMLKPVKSGIGVVAVDVGSNVSDCNIELGLRLEGPDIKLCNSASIFSMRCSMVCTTFKRSCGRSDRLSCIVSMSAMAASPAVDDAVSKTVGDCSVAVTAGTTSCRAWCLCSWR